MTLRESDKYTMRKKIYEDILDDIDEIKPDVPEEEPDIFVPEPGYGHSAFVMLCDTNPDGDYLIGRFSDVLDAKADEWRVGKINGNAHMRDFVSMFTGEWERRLTRVLDEERCIIVVQFNCPMKTAIETYILLMRLVRRAFHGFRVADDRLEHTAFAPDVPYMIINLFSPRI